MSEMANIFNTQGEIFWYLPKKVFFLLNLLGSARLVCIILGAVCTLKMVYNVILMNG